MRLFVAVWPPPEVIDVLARLERPSVEGVRWTAPSQWHVTLRFLGEIPDPSVGAVEAWLRIACASLSPVEVRLGAATDRFGRGVLHVPVEGLAPWADAVAGDVPGVEVPPTAAGREGPFVGHVTLARARARRGSVAALTGIAVPPGAPAWTATEVALVQSRLGAGGPSYVDLTRVNVDHDP